MLRRLAVLAVIVAAAVIVAGCGQSKQTAACGILANGSKLCGGDLKAYCKKFEQGSLDQSTTQVCAGIGVQVLPKTPEATPSTLAQECESAGASSRACRAWADSDEAVGVTRISPDAANCIRTGGRVRYCVSDEAP